MMYEIDRTLLFYGRTRNGDVRLLKLNTRNSFALHPDRSCLEVQKVEFDFLIPSWEFVNLMTRVSLVGEQPGRWDRALEFYSGTRP